LALVETLEIAVTAIGKYWSSRSFQFGIDNDIDTAPQFTIKEKVVV
jgi:hypothetical protein